jgi:hypothetical protein
MRAENKRYYYLLTDKLKAKERCACLLADELKSK